MSKLQPWLETGHDLPKLTSMRLLILSDLHLEWASFKPPRDVAHDAAVLAGDIGTGTKAGVWARTIFRADRWCSFRATTSPTGPTRVRQPARVGSRDRLENEAFSPTLEVEVRGRPTAARRARE